MAFADLTGRWLGRYDYADGSEGVSFEVDMVEIAGAVTGDVVEANTFRPDMGGELHAVFKGERLGLSVILVKTYLQFSQGGDPHYVGTANAALTRISGEWNFVDQRDWSGRFVMMRKPMAAAQAEREEAAPQDVALVGGR